MTFSVSFDLFLLLRAALRWPLLFLALEGAVMIFVWYGAADGDVFIISTLISRFGWSYLFNRRLHPQLVQDNLRMLGLLTFLLGITILPLTGYIGSV